MAAGGVVGVDGGRGDKLAQQEALRVHLVDVDGVAKGVAVPGRDLVVGGDLPDARVARAAAEAADVERQVAGLAGDVGVGDQAAGGEWGHTPHHAVIGQGVHVGLHLMVDIVDTLFLLLSLRILRIRLTLFLQSHGEIYLLHL